VALYKEAIEVLKKQGAEVIEIELMKEVGPLGPAEFLVLQYEFKDGLNRYLSAANATPKSLKEIIAFNKQHASTAMPYFQQETLESSEEKAGLDSKEYKEAFEKIHRRTSFHRRPSCVSTSWMLFRGLRTEWLAVSTSLTGIMIPVSPSLPPQRWQDIRILPSRWEWCGNCPSVFPLSRGRIRSRNCWRWRIASSRPRRKGWRRDL